MLSRKDICNDRQEDDVSFSNNLEFMPDGANTCLALHTNSNGIDLNIYLCLHTSCNLQQHAVQIVTWDLLVTHI